MESACMANSENPVVIIGGGLIGVSTAYSLASRGIRVILLEADSGLAQGASYANGGMLTPSMPDPWNSPGATKQLLGSIFDSKSPLLLRPSVIPSMFSWALQFLLHSSSRKHLSAAKANFHLAQFSTELTRQWSHKLGLHCERSNSGTLKVFRDKSSFEKSAALSDWLASFGLDFHRLGPTETVAVEPSLEPVSRKIYGALFYPNDLIGNAYLFVRELSEEVRGLGAEIRLDTRAESLIVRKGRLLGVGTDTGLVQANRVIVATGCTCPTLLKPIGIHLAIKPAKGYSVTFENEACLGPRLGVIDDAMHAAIVPIGRKLRIVGTAEFAGFDRSVPKKRIRNLLRLCENLYPGLFNKLKHGARADWAGLRPMSADGKPFIGESHIQGLFVNGGQGHLGWTMAAGSAELTASFLTGEAHPIDESFYRLSNRK